MLKTISCIFVYLLGFSAWAQTAFTIQSPRGSRIEILAHLPQRFDRILVIAPGQGCNAGSDLFKVLSNALSSQSTAVFRFEWEYCKTNPSSPTPSQNYVNELQDLNAVLQFASKKTLFPNKQILLAGKSMGSVLAYRVFQSNPQVQKLILLTPLCSIVRDDAGNPLPRPQQVGDRYYPGIKLQPRHVLFALGNQDEACRRQELSSFLTGSPSTIRAAIFAGDHGFRSFLSNGEIDSDLTRATLTRVARTVLTWLK